MEYKKIEPRIIVSMEELKKFFDRIDSSKEYNDNYLIRLLAVEKQIKIKIKDIRKKYCY